MTELKKAKEILEGKMGYSSGRLEESEIDENTSKSYKKSLDKHTVSNLLDTSLDASARQLKLLRKKRLLHEKIKKQGTDNVLMTRDLPNYKDEIITSRSSAYGAMRPFNIVANNGKRVNQFAI